MTAVGVVAHAEKSIDGGLEALRNALATEGVDDPMWEEVDKSRKVPKRIEKLVDRGADLIFVWGGDGSVQRAIDTVVGTSTTLAIVPAGTANLLATNLRIPQDVQQAVAIGIRGADRPLDVGKMNGERFAVMAGAGLDAEMIERGRRHDEGPPRPPRLRAVRSPRALGPRPDPDDDRGGRRPVVRG